MMRLATRGSTRTVEGMLTSSRTTRNKRRGAQLLEFAITLPLFLMMLLFSLDLGRIVFLSGVLHDATFTSARAGAQVGGATVSVAGGTETSKRAFTEAMAAAPGGTTASGGSTFRVLTGGQCARNVNSTNNFVTVQATYKVNFITPGLNSMLGLFSSSPDGWTLKATGVARCEVTRS